MKSWLSRRRLAAIVATLVLGAGSYLFFSEVFFTLSITVRAAIILAIALVLFAVTLAPFGDTELAGFGMIATYLAFVAYVVMQFPIPPAAAVLLFLVSFIGVMVLAYYVQNGRIAFTARGAATLAFAVFLLTAALVGVDTQIGTVEYSSSLEERVTLGNDSANVTQVQIGIARAQATVFREEVSFPDAEACVYTGSNRTNLAVLYRAGGRFFHGSVGGGDVLETRMNVRVAPETATAVDGPIPVERASECPAASAIDRPRVVVTGAPPPRANATG